MPSPHRRAVAEPDQPGAVGRAALALTAWTERWIPDAFIFALVATVIVVLTALTWTRATLPQVVDAWGGGFWSLIPFTMQMSLVIITGHVLATSAPMRTVIRAIAGWPQTPRGAVALVAFFAMASSWFNWGFSLIFSAVLAREVARRMPRVDYRALAAATFLGLGSIWAQGLSGSAALQMATPGALQPPIREIVSGGLVPGGLIPFTHTIFLWQSLVAVIVEIAVVTLLMWLATPPAGRARTACSIAGVGRAADRGVHNAAEDDRDPLRRRNRRAPPERTRPCSRTCCTAVARESETPQLPKSSKAIMSFSTPSSPSIFCTADSIMGGPQR